MPITRTIQARLVLDARAEAGESPWWSASEQHLYWVDIYGKRLHRFDPLTGINQTWETPDLITFVATHEHGTLVVALRDRVCHVDLAPDLYRVVARPALPPGGRLNDGTIDPRGRLLIGTVTAPGDLHATATLFVLDLDRSIVPLLEGFRTVNGLAFAPDGRTLYVSDSHPAVRTVWACDYDVERALIRRRRVFVKTNDLRGRPDGGCVDAEGCYWMAAVDGGCLLRFDEGGRPVGGVELPVEKPSKAAFADADLSSMFVTSLRRNLAMSLDKQPLAGGLFVAFPGVRGTAISQCAIKLD